ncbi:MAG: hypothetical protein LBF86_08910 [Helicobacteraceae bacterium]|jgi:mRNA-degrading endonuclease RelE of RelBE toxin-antitoxin system|nr:hypothetical protein [Helicobacteraceae bacterium]
MPLKVEFAETSLKTLDKIDKRDRSAIIERIYRFAETGLPRPKPLIGLFKGLRVACVLAIGALLL